MRKSSGAWLVAGAMLMSASYASANDLPEFLTVLPQATLSEALDDNYGHIQVSRIAEALMQAAEPQCVASRKLGKTEFDQVTRLILLEVEEAHSAARVRSLDRAKAEKLFAAEAGADVVTTVKATVNGADIRPYLDPLGEHRRMERVKVATEELQRLVQLLNLKQDIVFEPRAADDRELLELQEDIGEVVERAIAGFEPKIVHAFTTYEIAAKLAVEGATPEGAVQKLMPPSLLDVIRAPLEAHCIKGKS